MRGLRQDMYNELLSILKYWESNTIDTINGGFIGCIDYKDEKHPEADKGAVMNARILWAFSAAYPYTQNKKHLNLAERAFHYINKHFYDTEYGGVFWSLDYKGQPADTKNQVYALAFTIYGLAEFYAITHNEEALQLAIKLYHAIEEHSYDPVYKGYLEAFTRDWKPLEDLRLSDKDANEKKTMNTHLHIVEGYANLYRVWKSEKLKAVITELLWTINEYFTDERTGHLRLFFNEEWMERKDVVSYGHDIEAAWLLLWCAEIIEDKALTSVYKKQAIIMADATKEGIDTDGGLWYEYNPHENILVAEKHSWPQAELWIGMVNAWQLTGDREYLDIAEKNWQFVKKYIKDNINGEWFWGVYKDYSVMPKDKAGFWKCPYHNSRACIELLKRLPE